MSRYLRSATLDTTDATDGYPFTLPAVRALDDLEFGTVTVLVGGNGTGKSTLVEALAVASGFNPEGGSKNLQFKTHDTHSPLSDALILRWEKRPRWGWFLRAETFYGMATHIELDDDPLEGVKALFPDLHRRSHGESFLTLAESRMTGNGLYYLDEPESALSFHGQLVLTRIIHDAVQDGAQFIIATHSPLLMAFPGAHLYELDETGATRTAYDDIESVGQWRSFLNRPEATLRPLLED
jgi:predicted ATPase